MTTTEAKQRERETQARSYADHSNDIEKLIASLFGGKLVLQFRDLQTAGIVNDRATLRRRQKNDSFPQAILLSSNSVGWLATEIAGWLKNRPRGQAQQPRWTRQPVSKAPVTLPNAGGASKAQGAA